MTLLIAQAVTVFLIAGQSNAQGYGNRTQLAPVPAWAQNVANGWEGHPTRSSDTGIEYLHPTPANAPGFYNENKSGLLSMVTDGWGSYDGQNPPFGYHAGERDLYGPELSFLARYRADHPTETIATIKVVLGGSGITDWLPPNGSMWAMTQTMITQAKARLDGRTIVWGGLLWMHGENGAASYYPYLHPTPGQAYSDQIRSFFASVRSLTSQTMPVMVGRIGEQMLAPAVIGTYVDREDTPANRLAATQYRRSQQELVGGDPGNVWFDTDGLPTLHDNTDPQFWYHVTGAGYLAMGERAYTALSGSVPPPPPTPLVTMFNGDPKAWTVTFNGVVIGGDGDVIAITGDP